MASEDSRISPRFLLASALLLAVAAVLFGYRLSREDVSGEAEARVLLTAAELESRGAWLIPTIGGEDRWERPPLYMWAAKVVSLFTAETTPLVSRLPGALCVTLVALLAAWWSRQHMARYPRDDNPDLEPSGHALLTGLIFVCNPEIFSHARDGVPDSLFMALCFAAFYCLGESFETRRSYYAARPWRHWVIAAYVLTGLAMMTKGPVAFLFVFIPYAATCLNYRMRRPDWIHLAGVPLAAVIGGWWYVAAARIDPSAWKVFMDELFTRRFGADAVGHQPFYYYLKHAAVYYFPWNIPACVLAWRTIVRGERTPTRLLWAWSFVSGTAWLSLVGSKNAEYYLPVAPFILLLAGDALAHWNYDGRAGKAFRALMRTLRWTAILLAVPVSVLYSSDAGLAAAILLALVNFGLLFHRYRTTVIYALWSRTIQGAWMLVLVFLAAEILYVRDYIPRKDFLGVNEAFAKLVKAHLPPGASLHLYGGERSALYSYHLGAMPPVAEALRPLAEAGRPDTYVLADDRLAGLAKRPYLTEILSKGGETSDRPKAVLFKVQPAARATSPTLAARHAGVPPVRLLAAGSVSGSKDDVQAVVRRILKTHEKAPLHGVLLLGDSLKGTSRFSRADFPESFELPFKKIIKEGLPLYGVLGLRDQDLAPLIVRYPPLLMGERRYSACSFGGGLVRLFRLDGPGLAKGDDAAEAQWAWLEKELADCRAPWRVMALHPALAPRMDDEPFPKEAAKRLLDLAGQTGVDFILWGQEPLYQRVELPEGGPVMIGTGWSGDADAPPERPSDPSIKALAAEEPGVVLLEFGPSSANFRAIEAGGRIVDSGEVPLRPGRENAFAAGEGSKRSKSD